MILIILAAICKAIADCLDHGFDTSVFKKLNPAFWDPNVIHKTGKKIFGYPIDAWHLFNSGMIVCFLVAIVTAGAIDLFGVHIWGGFAAIAYGIVFNIVFVIAYKTLRRKWN